MKWDYGDEVVLAAADERGAPVMRSCAVVGITPVDTAELSAAVGCPLGTVLYTVEFSDGSDALVLESALLPLGQTAL